MYLTPLPPEKLDHLGLVDYPWMVRDPENTRYFRDEGEAFLIQSGKEICGFMMRRLAPSQNTVDYLLFTPRMTEEQIEFFCQMHLPKPTDAITTYDRNFHPGIWKKMGWKIRWGQQYMEKSLTPQLAQPSECHKKSLNLCWEPLAWPKDHARVTALFQTCFPREDWCQIKGFQKDPYAKQSVLFAIMKDEEAVGLWIDTSFDQDVCFLGWIGVVFHRRGQGIGNQIMHQGIQGTNARGYKQLTLLVQPDNTAAKALYLRHGFQPTWQRIHLSSSRG